MTKNGGPKAEVSAQGVERVGERPWSPYANVNPGVRAAPAIQDIERLTCTLEVAHGLSIGQNLACRVAQQRDQIRDPRLHGSEGHLTPTCQQRGRNTAASRLEFLGRSQAPGANVNGALGTVLRLEWEFGQGHGRSPDPRGRAEQDEELGHGNAGAGDLAAHIAQTAQGLLDGFSQGLVPLGDQTLLTAAPDNARPRSHERACGRNEGGGFLPDGRHLLLQAPIGPNVPEPQRQQDRPEPSRNVERGPFESAPAVVMDAKADEKRQANGQAQRDAGWTKRPNEPARKCNKEHQRRGDPPILTSEI